RSSDLEGKLPDWPGDSNPDARRRKAGVGSPCNATQRPNLPTIPGETWFVKKVPETSDCENHWGAPPPDRRGVRKRYIDCAGQARSSCIQKGRTMKHAFFFLAPLVFSGGL